MTTLIPTHGLRWNFGVLEQRYLKTNGVTEVWVAVPSITPRGVTPEQLRDLAAQPAMPPASLPVG